jgi:prepilin-type N-terminal cleavage/methylation domain-containing protein
MNLALRQPGLRGGRLGRAFTLLELLVVIGLIAILTTLAVPILRGLRGGSETSSASRQLLDDLGLARLKAISERTTVYVFFVTTNFWPAANPGAVGSSRTYNNLVAGQLTDYALYLARSVGDQPGAPHGRYLTAWKSLPDGVFIPTWKFDTGATAVFPDRNQFVAPFLYYDNTGGAGSPIRVAFPTTGANLAPPAAIPNLPSSLPYIAFNSSGALVDYNQVPVPDQFIPLARGDIFPLIKDAMGYFPATPADAKEIPPNNSINNPNLIRINALTGRGRVERPELP